MQGDAFKSYAALHASALSAFDGEADAQSLTARAERAKYLHTAEQTLKLATLANIDGELFDFPPSDIFNSSLFSLGFSK